MTRRRYIWRIKILRAPRGPRRRATMPGGRTHFLTERAARHHAERARSSGFEVEVQRSNEVTWREDEV